MDKINHSISPTKLWNRLNEIEQEVNLGTFDNIIIASLFLVLALSISVLLWTFSNLNSIFNILLATILLFFIIFLSQVILGYLNSTIFKENRFSNKVNALTILLAFTIFLITVIVIPLVIEFLFPTFDQQKSSHFIILAIVIYGIPAYFAIKIYPKVIRFFVKSFPNLFLKTIRRMNKEKRKKSLKKIGMSLSELKTLCLKY